MRVFCKGSVYVDVLNCAYGLFCLGCYCLCPCLYSTRKIVFIRIRVTFKVNTVSAVGEEFFLFTVLFKLQLVRCNFILILAMLFGILEC